MKNKMNLQPSVRPKLKLKKAFVVYTTVSVALLGIGTWLLISFLNLGNVEPTYAGTVYSSNRTGNWTASSTWNGASVPPIVNFSDQVVLNSNHEVTLSSPLDVKNGASVSIAANGKLVINGDVTVQNNLTLLINGELVINGRMDVKNGAAITVNGSGTMGVSGNMSFENNTNFTVDGVLNVGGSLSFGSNANFNGSGTVQIMGTGCSNWSGPGGCSDLVSLPVELLDFVVTQHADGVQITWKTAQEINNDYFTVERSADGRTFEIVSTVPGNGTTTNVSTYQLIDKTPLAGRSYYRLIQTDYDGKTETFRAAVIDVDQVAANPVTFTVYPNPFKGTRLNVRFTEPVAGTLEVLDYNGAAVASQTLDGYDATVAVTVDENLPAGVYYIKVVTSSGEKTARLIKQ